VKNINQLALMLVQTLWFTNYIGESRIANHVSRKCE